MKKSHPNADPQTWANTEHLDRILAQNGPDAAAEEFQKMFAPGGNLPRIERCHREEAAAYRRWNDLPPLPETESKSAASSTPQPTTK
jgi:hypothetical protein